MEKILAPAIRPKERRLAFDVGTLNPYTGSWDTTEVVHLVKRTQFGATPSQINALKNLGMSAAVDQLLTPTAAPTTFPLNNYSQNGYVDPTGVAPWDTWINVATGYADDTLNGKRVDSMRSWWMGQVLQNTGSIHEKMTLFWHNHFGMDAGQHLSDIPATLWFNQYQTLRANALGNFRTLVKAITLDPAMLIYLNGNTNKKTAPNENYGRELQELYTVGKGPGSHYTESDVQAAARVLTGHSVDNNFAYYFDAAGHNDQNKSFSNFYSNTIITGRSGAAGAGELDDLLSMIFSNPEVSKYICRNLYNFFVYYVIDDTIETNIIAPLSQIFVNSGFDLVPVLSALFKSEHFYNMAYSSACLIKSPLDFLVGLVHEYGVNLPDATDPSGQYSVWGMLMNRATQLQQQILGIPLVAGWYAYYQAPAFHELWINSVTYTERNAYTDLMIATGDMSGSVTMQIDTLAFAQQLANPSDPNLLISQSLDVLYRVPISTTSQQYLKQTILLSGQTNDYYWTDAYNAFLNNPTDMVARNTVQTRLQALYKYLMNLPEYQLS